MVALLGGSLPVTRFVWAELVAAAASEFVDRDLGVLWVAGLKDDNVKLKGFLVGQSMKKPSGTAIDPKRVQQIVHEELAS